MLCPQCKHKASCIDSRKNPYGVRRRYRCKDHARCGASFSTVEEIVMDTAQGRTLMARVGQAQRQKWAAEVRVNIEAEVAAIFDRFLLRTHQSPSSNYSAAEEK